jgi:hypothetical protein
MLEWWDLRASGSPTLNRVEVVFLVYAGTLPGQAIKPYAQSILAFRNHSAFQEMKLAAGQLRVSAFRHLTPKFFVC